MKSVSREKLLKRRSTRHVSEITAIASKFGNSAKIIVPRSWLRKRVIALLHSHYYFDHLDFHAFPSVIVSGKKLSWLSDPSIYIFPGLYQTCAIEHPTLYFTKHL